MSTVRKSTFTIQAWSAWLVVACILPATVASALLIWQSYKREWAIMERNTVETARALMQAVDRDLSSAQGDLLALATSPSLQTGKLADFYLQARKVLQYRKGNSIVLSDRSGQALVHTRLPPGSPLPAYDNPRQLRRVIDLARPAISDLYRDPLSGGFLISVDVPVFREGKVANDLSMQFSPSYLAETLKQQRVATERIVSIFDSAGIVVARTRSPELFVGKPGAPALLKEIGDVPEGVVRTRTLEGIDVVAAFSRSTISNWAVAIGIPLWELRAGLWKALLQVITGTVILVVATLVAARAIGQRITGSIRSLIPPAIALGNGDPLIIPELRLREAAEVGQALVLASKLLAERTTQRDRAERAEKELLDVKLRLEHSEALQRRIFEEGPDPILLIGPSGRILRANQEAERLFGHTRQHLLALTVEDLVPPAARERHAALRAAFLVTPHRRTMGRGEQYNLIGLRADGTEFPIDVMLSPLQSTEGILVIATVRDITERRRKEADISAALREKETLLRELYHRVKNNLQVISSLFNLQVRTLPVGPAQEALKEGAGRVRAMALVHEKLYQSGNLASISLDEYIADLGVQLGNAANAEQRGIRLAYDTEPIEAGLETAVPLGLMLNELICNSLKHAFPKGEAGTITVALHRQSGTTIQMVVTDDGIGFPPGLDVTSNPSLGLKLVKALTAQLDGSLQIESCKGARIILSIPLHRHTEAGSGVPRIAELAG